MRTIVSMLPSRPAPEHAAWGFKMVDRQRSVGADKLREHDDGQSLLGRTDSDAATCGCIPVMRAVAARDVARHAGTEGGATDGDARDGESSHARTPDFEPAVSSDCAAPRDAADTGTDSASGSSDSPRSARLPTVAASAFADSPRARPQPSDDPPRNAAEIDGCSVGVTLEPPSHDASVAAEPKPPVAKLPRTSIAELSVTAYSYISHQTFLFLFLPPLSSPLCRFPSIQLSVTAYSYISHRAFVRELLCSCCSRHAATCAARTGRHCSGCDCNGSGSSRHGGSSSSLAGWADVALERVSIVAHLTTFSIIGIAVQHGMDLLFGPEVAHVTSDEQAIFIDLPANMVSAEAQAQSATGCAGHTSPRRLTIRLNSSPHRVKRSVQLPCLLGCFLLGMLGVVFLPALLAHSRHLAIGLVVGLCGSISTFATWNQRMLAIATAGLWVRALFGYFAATHLGSMKATAFAIPKVPPSPPCFSSLLLLPSNRFRAAHHLPCRRGRHRPQPLLSPLLPLPPLPVPTLLPLPFSPPILKPHTSTFLLFFLSPIPLTSHLPAPLPIITRPPPRHPHALVCACPLGGGNRGGRAGRRTQRQPAGLLPRLRARPTRHLPALVPAAAQRGWPWAVVPKGDWEGKGASGEDRRGGGEKRKWEEGAGAAAWMPWGTLTANVGAAALEAVISVAYLAAKSHTSQVIVGGVQLGFLTGLSTVSMLSLEILYFHYTLGTPWRSYVYLLSTILPSFLIGILVYSVPVWVMALATLVAALAVLAPASATTYRSTFSDGINSGGGACFYEGNFRDSEYFYKGLTAYLPQNKYDGGKGCGTCYEIECKNHKSCRSGSVIVRATGRHGDDQFLLASTAWDKIVRGRDAGYVEIKFRSVDCPKNGDIGVKIMPGTNQYWFAVQILGAAKAGGVEGVELSKDGKKWSKMKRLAESATWALDPAKEIVDAGKKVSVRVTAVGGARVELKDVIPEKWTVGNTYKSSTNF
ncbi:unnamed protein product [Closterium sp. Yama58-4]|nr:unnamed protein product [Closterium sp. Yama58-4]